jgi:phenylalanyl-tRNA synthetase beta chain
MDSNMTEIAIDRLARLISELGGGKIAKNRADVFPKKVLSKKIKLNLIQTEKLLGIKIPKKEVVRILKSLGLEINNKFEVKIPTRRPDLTESHDLIEEIGRIYGYEKIAPVFPRLALMPAQRNQEIVWQERIKNILQASGFFELYNYSFISKKNGDMFGGRLVELENPFSEEFYYLRPNLLINLFENIKHNSKYLQKGKEIKIFELGKVFKKKEKGVEEKKMLVGMLVGSKEDFYILKGAVDGLLEGLGISDKFYDHYQTIPDDSQRVFWNQNKNKSAEIKVVGKKIGFLGEFNFPALKQRRELFNIVAFEIDFHKLIKFCSEEQEHKTISIFPSAVRDVAILLPSRVKVVDVLNKINIAGGKLVQDVDLFDIYEGKELAEERKSLAFHILFQAEDRTLSGEEIDKLFQKIIKALEENTDWEVRR